VRLLGTNPATFRSTAALRLLEPETPLNATRTVDALIQPGMTMEQIEKEAVHRALKQTGGRRTEAAQLLGLSVRTLQRKIKDYDLE
jgi:transcriptional regulator with PAS, ATPase and Fis domain